MPRTPEQTSAEHPGAAPKPARSRRKPSEPVRLQRFLADAGVASRRDCEAMIESGRVEVNGSVVTTLPVFITPGVDRVVVDNKPILGVARRVYVLFNKPPRTLVTNADEPGFERRTIATMVQHPAAARLFPVGRLDWDSTGLVLLTNDGTLANRLSHPRFGVEKTYRAIIRGSLNDEGIRDLQRSVNRVMLGSAKRASGTTPGHRSAEGGIQLTRVRADDSKTEIRIVAREGSGRRAERPAGEQPPRGSYAARRGRTPPPQRAAPVLAPTMRDAFALVGSPIKKLERIAIGPLQLVGVGRGLWRELTREEVRALKLAARGKSATIKPRAPGARPRRRPNRQDAR